MHYIIIDIPVKFGMQSMFFIKKVHVFLEILVKKCLIPRKKMPQMEPIPNSYSLIRPENIIKNVSPDLVRSGELWAWGCPARL